MKLPISLVIPAVAFTTTTRAQPILTSQPVSQSVSLGANVTFQVTTSGAAPLHFQWRFDGLDLVNATNRSLVITNVQVSRGGNYLAVVSNASGSVTRSSYFTWKKGTSVCRRNAAIAGT